MAIVVHENALVSGRILISNIDPSSAEWILFAFAYVHSNVY